MDDSGGLTESVSGVQFCGGGTTDAQYKSCVYAYTTPGLQLIRVVVAISLELETTFGSLPAVSTAIAPVSAAAAGGSSPLQPFPRAYAVYQRKLHQLNFVRALRLNGGERQCSPTFQTGSSFLQGGQGHGNSFSLLARISPTSTTHIGKNYDFKIIK